jgi:hypothetical protein
MKWAQELSFSPRIKFDQLFRMEASMGQVTPPATGNPDFGQHFFAPFQDLNRRFRVQLGCLDGREKTCRTASYYCDFHGCWSDTKLLHQGDFYFPGHCGNSLLDSFDVKKILGIDIFPKVILFLPQIEKLCAHPFLQSFLATRLVSGCPIPNKRILLLNPGQLTGS